MTAPFWSKFLDAYEGEPYAENEWDLLYLDKKPVPGVAVVKCTAEEKIDEQKGSGTDGATFIVRGRMPAKIDITVKLWTADQWQLWQELLEQAWRQPHKPARQDTKVDKIPPTIRRPEPGKTTISADEATKRTGAIEIAHPALLPGVTHVVIKQVDGPVDAPERGAKHVHLVALQYIPRPVTVVNSTRKIEGPKLDPNITQAAAGAKNTAPSKPSATDGVPALLARPKEGRF